MASEWLLENYLNNICIIEDTILIARFQIKYAIFLTNFTETLEIKMILHHQQNNISGMSSLTIANK